MKEPFCLFELFIVYCVRVQENQKIKTPRIQHSKKKNSIIPNLVVPSSNTPVGQHYCRPIEVLQSAAQ